MIIIVTGTPGTGKTTLAKKIAKFDYEYIDVNKVISKHKLSERYDRKRKCKIIDEKKLAKVLDNLAREAKKEKRNIVIDSHLSHYTNPKYVDLCIITRCGLKILKNRLKKKGYSKQKINDNMECEIMDVILEEAKKHKIKIFDTSKGILIKEIKKII